METHPPCIMYVYIRIRICNADPDPGGQKNDPQTSRKVTKFHFFEVQGSYLLKTEGFSCSLDISKLQFYRERMEPAEIASYWDKGKPMFPGHKAHYKLATPPRSQEETGAKKTVGTVRFNMWAYVHCACTKCLFLVPHCRRKDVFLTVLRIWDVYPGSRIRIRNTAFCSRVQFFRSESTRIRSGFALLDPDPDQRQ
jgi:hypothetical protein